MATPSEKLAESLEILKDLQKGNSTSAIRAGDLSRTHRERLMEQGFIQEVIKGWYISTKPDESRGDSTSWYTSFWRFCSTYLHDRFGNDWTLSPDQSLLIQSGNWTVPQQLLVRSPHGQNNTVEFPFNTSLFDVRATMPPANYLEEKDGVKIYTVPASLIESSPGIFTSNPIDTRTVLSLVRDASDILPVLLNGGHTVIAGRLAGAFRNIGKTRIADDILKAMQSAGYDSRESDPFTNKVNTNKTGREASPYVNRIRLMWATMREIVIDRFPKAPGLPKDKAGFLKHVEEVYVTDAYHSLSIEGYKVTPELIERVRSGTWNPEGDEKDKELRNALAARGYYQAYQAVLISLEKILSGQNSGEVTDRDHGDWYRELFAPSIVAGILRPADLAGYRNEPVYIRRSMHVPLNRDAVRDAMPALFELLQEETDPGVRVVLGHFIFVYIHPYMDGNGRIARFLMNAMLVSGGYTWTIVPVEERKTYMEALEHASVRQNIKPFTDFLANLVEKGMRGEPLPKIPSA